MCTGEERELDVQSANPTIASVQRAGIFALHSKDIEWISRSVKVSELQIGFPRVRRILAPVADTRANLNEQCKYHQVEHI